MTRLLKWRKMSDPSLMGVSSWFCKMTQIVRPFIYGRFITNLIQNNASAHKWRVGRFASFYKSLMKRPQMEDRTICVILKIVCFEEKVIEHQQMKGRTVCVILKILDKAPMNEGSDTLRHFAKSWWSACKRLFRSMMCERFMKNAFENLQNLNFRFFIKFDVPLGNKKLGLYYLQEKNAFF